MSTTGFKELIILMLIIGALHITGLLPVIMRALRQLFGGFDDADESDTPGAPPSKHDVEVCYRLLGVSPSTPWEDVERAYRRKAKVHHPDRGGDEDAMRALNEAYALLKRLRGRR